MNQDQNKEIETIVVSSCNDCPVCRANDMMSGFSCKLKEYPDNLIREDSNCQAITPKWCPLKTNDIIFKYSE